jgi:hypothetical protein
MVLILFAVIGFLVGYRLEMTRAGFITMALTAIGFSGAQILLLFLIQSRDAVTMLPLVVGLTVVSFMFIGAVIRVARRGGKRAA